MADTPGSGLPIVGIVISVLESLFGTSTDTQGEIVGLQTAATNEWANQLTVAQWAWGVLSEIGSIIKSIGLAIALALYHLWIDYLKPILDRLLKWLKWLHDHLNKILKPIDGIIKKIRDWYVRHILKWQLLAVNILSALRLFLSLLSLLDVKWAKKLDADLAKIQAYVTQSIVDITTPLNQALGILGLAINPGMVFNPVVMSSSLWASLTDVKSVAGFGSQRPLYASEAQQEQQQKQAVYGTRALSTTGPDGSIVYDPALKVVDDAVTQQMQTEGVGP